MLQSRYDDDNGDIIPLSERFNEDKEDIRYQARGGFSNALNNKEWASFYSTLTKENQRNAFRIGDNGILIPNENNSDNYKLVCYEGDSNTPIVTAFYKLENYDYNMHEEKQLDVSTIMKLLERSQKSDKYATSILDNCQKVYGTIFRKYNGKTGRFVKISRSSIKNLQYSDEKPDRTGISENAGQGISDNGIKEQSRKSVSEIAMLQSRYDDDLFFGLTEDEDELLNDYVTETLDNDGAGAIARLIYDTKISDLSDVELLKITQKVLKQYDIKDYFDIADEFIKILRDEEYMNAFTDSKNDYTKPLIDTIRRVVDNTVVTNKENRET